MTRIVIGKQTLESLTAGMYTDPLVIYREFIQNAVDSIDEAYDKGVIEQGGEKIEITVDALEGHISVKDNGLGVPTESVIESLVSIGNSSKRSSNSRGFRGIGRLAALSYCEKLVFRTSALGESFASKVIINAEKLAELLAVDNHESLSIEEVMHTICTIETETEKANQHYFNVDMLGVNSSSELLDVNRIVDYITQVAPLSYNEEEFPWGKEIYGRIALRGYRIPQYNIYLINGSKYMQLYKAYQSNFIVDRAKGLRDTVNDISIHELKNAHDELIALAWTAKTNYRGSIWNSVIKGIRVRKGNMLIGDAQTLNVIFKDARFNGWSIGEVFALDPQLLPNARRDNFEKNPAFFLFSEQMTTIANDITRSIRAASASRNSEVASALDNLDDATETAESFLRNDTASAPIKGFVTQRLNSAQQKLETFVATDEVEKVIQDIAFEELDMIIGKVKGVTSFKALNTIKTLSGTEKRILERVFKSIQENSKENASEMIDVILNEFCH
jgi:molecular chaperone HtpG